MCTNDYHEASQHCPDVPCEEKSADTLVPNRIFVGGISPHTTEAELHTLFAKHGSVKAAKIIADKSGISRGYGFVTFDNEEEAKKLQKEGNILLKGKRLNIGPAIIKKRSQNSDSHQDNQSCAIVYSNPALPSCYNGSGYCASYGLFFQPQVQPAYSVLIPQAQYVCQPQVLYNNTTPEPYVHPPNSCRQALAESTDVTDLPAEGLPKNVTTIPCSSSRVPNCGPYIYCNHPTNGSHFAKFALCQHVMNPDRLNQDCDIPEAMLQPFPLTPPPTPINKHYKMNN